MSAQTPSPVDRTVSVLSLLVAVVALLLSVLLVYNGSARQNSFEAQKTRCLDSLHGFGESLTTLTVGRSVDADLAGELSANRVRVVVNCKGILIAEDARFWDRWGAETEVWEDPMFILVSNPDLPPGREQWLEITLTSGVVFLSLVNSGSNAVAEMQGPGVWPFGEVEQVSPSLPASTPSPSP